MDKLRTTIILSLILAMFTVVVMACNQPIEADIPEAAQEQIQEEATHMITPFIAVHVDKDTPETESVTEEATEPPVTIVETESSTESSTEKYYIVNLSEDVQDVIFAECEKHSISPAIVIALIERESQFNQYAMGDDGRSFGLMQVQVKNHLQRMIDLDCTDLFDPIKNVKVGINYLAECYNRYGSIDKALVAYNAGSYKGTITNYAKSIMARASELAEVTR